MVNVNRLSSPPSNLASNQWLWQLSNVLNSKITSWSTIRISWTYLSLLWLQVWSLSWISGLETSLRLSLCKRCRRSDGDYSNKGAYLFFFGKPLFATFRPLTQSNEKFEKRKAERANIWDTIRFYQLMSRGAGSTVRWPVNESSPEHECIVILQCLV
jgi:hypothetical protein